VVLVARDGRFAAHAVSPGGGPIYIPPDRKRSGEAAKQSQKAAPSPVQVAKTNAPRTLSVEEISAELARQSAKRTNSPAAASAPTPLTQPQESTPEPTPVPLTPATEPTQPVAVATTAPKAVVPTKPEDPGPTVGADSGQRTKVAADESEVVRPPISEAEASPGPTPVSAVSEPNQQRPQPSVSDIPIPDPEERGTRPDASSAQQATVVPTKASSSAKTSLLIGAGLLLVAAALSWLFFRNLRPHPTVAC
jgi:hypothetical protein